MDDGNRQLEQEYGAERKREENYDDGCAEMSHKTVRFMQCHEQRDQQQKPRTNRLNQTQMILTGEQIDKQ